MQVLDNCGSVIQLVMATSERQSSLSDNPQAVLETVKTVAETGISANPSKLSNLQVKLPRPPQKRLEASLSEKPFDLGRVESPEDLRKGHPPTVLYLAYGSNLCDETFRGKRKIKPLSSLNVLVPSLALVFDLPGLPYIEPCFANTKERDSTVSLPPETLSNSTRDFLDKHDPLSTSDRSALLHEKTLLDDKEKSWKKPLVGVVYEVTPGDFAHIIATEGGGSGYQDVLVQCHPFPEDWSKSDRVPQEPQTPAFKAHTLFAPSDKQRRRNPSYAEASARYLNLIKVGASEHELPDEYRDYLSDLHPYTITTQGQRLGRFVVRMLWYPILMAVFSLNRVFADKRGRSPEWLRRLQTAVFAGIWATYDAVFHDLFGDGERTQRDGS